MDAMAAMCTMPMICSGDIFFGNYSTIYSKSMRPSATSAAAT